MYNYSFSYLKIISSLSNLVFNYFSLWIDDLPIIGLLSSNYSMIVK